MTHRLAHGECGRQGYRCCCIASLAGLRTVAHDNQQGGSEIDHALHKTKTSAAVWQRDNAYTNHAACKARRIVFNTRPLTPPTPSPLRASGARGSRELPNPLSASCLRGEGESGVCCGSLTNRRVSIAAVVRCAGQNGSGYPASGGRCYPRRRLASSSSAVKAASQSCPPPPGLAAGASPSPGGFALT